MTKNITTFGLIISFFLLISPTYAEVSQDAMIDIFQRLDELEKKSRELHGENEVLKHELEKLKKIQKEGFLNVDERVEALSTQIKSSKSVAETTPAPEKDKPKVVAVQDVTPVTKEPEKEDTKTDTKENKTAKSKAPTKYQKETYQAAFEKMKKSPTAATLAFEEYIKMQPDSPLAANAQYWIGEIKYSHNNYKGAIQEFVKVLQNHKYSDKAPDAAIKLGYSFYALKNWVYARRTFEDVLKYFPENENAVHLAKKRLAKLDAAGH